MTTKKKLIAGNWKMNGSLEANDALVRARGRRHAGAACDRRRVRAGALPRAGADAAPRLALELGAQDVSQHEQGAYTGEVSAAMLREFGVRYAIVGHSERRQYHGEGDQLVADKAKAALAHGITPIVCVGETLAEREAGQTEDVVQAPARRRDPRQRPLHQRDRGRLRTGLGHRHRQDRHARAGAAGARAAAQAAGKAATPQAERVPILYGGSMNAANAASLLAQPDIDGGLIGGASLKAPDFLQIIAAAAPDARRTKLSE
jgi:triosephosphate isomerase